MTEIEIGELPTETMDDGKFVKMRLNFVKFPREEKMEMWCETV